MRALVLVSDGNVKQKKSNYLPYMRTKTTKPFSIPYIRFALYPITCIDFERQSFFFLLSYHHRIFFYFYYPCFYFVCCVCRIFKTLFSVKNKINKCKKKIYILSCMFCFLLRRLFILIPRHTKSVELILLLWSLNFGRFSLRSFSDVHTPYGKTKKKKVSLFLTH